MGSRGSRWSPAQVHALQRSAGNRAVGALLGAAPRRALQRAIGVELEESRWEVGADPGVPIAKGTPVVDRPQFELQAEFGGGNRTNLEIVTKPPGVDEASFPGMLTAMAGLIAELDARQAGGPFKASDLAGGLPGYTIRPGPGPFVPFLQITVGVPLAAMPAFFDAVKAGGSATAQAPGPQTRTAVASQLATDLELDEAPSGKLLGFITLLGHYMLEGRSKSTFPKGSIGALAKTDFAEIFMMLPSAEREAIRTHLDRWVAAIAGLGRAADQYAAKGALPPSYAAAQKPVLADSYYDPQADLPPMTVTTTRDEWLRTMVSTTDADGNEQKGRDALSVKGKLAAPDTPEMAGMGAKEKQALKLGKDVVESWGGEGEVAELGKIRAGRLTAANADQIAIIDKLIADLKELQAGFGALGAKHDEIRYHGESGPGYSATDHRAVIVEIRRPQGGGWQDQARSIFEALTRAIETQAPAVQSGPRFSSLPPAPQPVPPQLVPVEQTVEKLASTAEAELAQTLT